MNHDSYLLAQWPDAHAAATSASGIGLSIVIPVYRGAATIGRLVDALAALNPAGGLEVILVNDDFTPREFVVMVLKAEFRMSEDQALRVMMTAHRRGACVVARA